MALTPFVALRRLSNSQPAKFGATSFSACNWRIQSDRKSTRLNSSHGYISYAVFCLKKKKQRKIGSQRVLDSPLAKAAILATPFGIAPYGLTPVCAIQFSGFAFQCVYHIALKRVRHR